MQTDQKIYYCPVEVALDVIVGKWKALILWYLKEDGVLRHGELLRRLPDISQKVLTEQLRALEEDDLVHREVYAEVPPRVEYSLTQPGQELKELLDGFSDWGEKYARRKGVVFTPLPCESEEEAV